MRNAIGTKRNIAVTDTSVYVIPPATLTSYRREHELTPSCDCHLRTQNVDCEGVGTRRREASRRCSALVSRWGGPDALHVQEWKRSSTAVGGGSPDDYKAHRLIKTPRIVVLFVDVDTQRPGRDALGVGDEQRPRAPSSKIWINEQPVNAIGRVAEKTNGPALIIDEQPPIHDGARKLLGDKRPKCLDVVGFEKGMRGADGALPQREHGSVIRPISATHMEAHRGSIRRNDLSFFSCTEPLRQRVSHRRSRIICPRSDAERSRHLLRTRLASFARAREARRRTTD